MSPNIQEPEESKATSVILRRTHHHIELVSLAVALLVIASVLTLFAVSNYIIHSNVRQTRMLDLVYNWERLLSGVKEAEIDQRDFLLTGNENDLTAFNGVAARVTQLLETITPQEDDPNIASQLRELTGKRIAYLQSAIDVRRSQGSVAVETVIRKAEGKAIMARLTQLATKLQDIRTASVMREMKRQDESARLLASIFVILGLANILFLGWSYNRIDKAIKARDASLSMRYETPGAQAPVKT